jgi:hypothetical protein
MPKPSTLNPREAWVLDAPTNYIVRRRAGVARYHDTQYSDPAEAIAACLADRRGALYAVRSEAGDTRIALLNPEWTAVLPGNRVQYPTPARIVRSVAA